MSWYEWPLWLLLGAGTALIFLQTQKWSVQQISPTKPVISQLLILGGMLLRWSLIAVILVLALKHDPLAGLTVFGAFMVSRLVILANWEKRWRVAAVQTNTKKD